MATRMMLRNSKNNAPVLQLLSLMKDKTVSKRFPRVAKPSVFSGGFWPSNGQEEWRSNEGKDAFIREKGWWGGGFNEKSVGVEVRGRRMVSDEDDYEGQGDVSSEDFDDFDDGDDDDNGFGDKDGDGDDDDDDEEEEEEEEEKKKYVKKSRK